MKSFFVLTAMIAAAFAQNVSIGAPAAGTQIPAGRDFTVGVDRPNSLTGSMEVAIAIGISSCTRFPGGSCDSVNPSNVLGTILYSGDYSPQIVTPGKPPFQNFTVQIPEAFPQGAATLTVSHFSLVGAGPFPFLEVKNTTVQIV